MSNNLYPGTPDDEALIWVEDPIVAEVHAIREELAAKFDFDIHRILDDARKKEIASGRRLIPAPSLANSGAT